LNEQVEEDEMVRACSMNGGRRGTDISYWLESQKERDHQEKDVGGQIIL
jgi:hypothetical protein